MALVAATPRIDIATLIAGVKKQLNILRYITMVETLLNTCATEYNKHIHSASDEVDFEM